jgi:histidine phosphotransferase ChpT
MKGVETTKRNPIGHIQYAKSHDDGDDMDLMIDMRIAELLASRLCHDLVGPIGAVNNGLELIEDEELGMADDAIQLAGKSAAQASTLLQFYRLAYGMAGSRQGEDLGPIRELARNFLDHSKSELDWPSGPVPDNQPEGLGKLLLNMVAFAVEALPRGGTVGVALAPSANGVEVEVKAVGADAGLRDDAKAGLADGFKIDELTPRNVHGHFTSLLTKRMGGELRAEQAGQGYLRLAATVSA